MSKRSQAVHTPPAPSHADKLFAPLEARRAQGRSRRDTVKRTSQADWKPSHGRPNPVAELLSANKDRHQELLPIKWGRMDASPFGFFRGAAPLMAMDLGMLPATGLEVQMCGDAHILNLGAYASPDGHLVFDINDFDETLRGPWEWDVKRLATSLVLAGRGSGESKSGGMDAVRAFVESYRAALKVFSEMKVVDLARWEIRPRTGNDSVRTVFEKAERTDAGVLLKKLTVPDKSKMPRFHDLEPVLSHVPEATAKAVLASLKMYRDGLGVDYRHFLDAYRPVDVAFKLVGTGSVGTLDYVVLMLGNGPDDALFLQIKEEVPSCYAPYLPAHRAVTHEGQRVANGQRRIQTVSDPFLGWTTVNGEDYLVRQLSDHKASVDVTKLEGRILTEYGVLCGELLAKAHARTGDAAAISGYCGDSTRLDRAIAKFAVAYADQTERDYSALRQAIKVGKLKTHNLGA